MARQGSQRTRDGHALVAAVLLHALSLTALRGLARFDSPAGTPRAVATSGAEQEYELDVAPIPVAELDAERKEVPSQSTATARVQRSRSPVARNASGQVAAAEAATPSSEVIAVPNTEEDTLAESMEVGPEQPIDLGVGPEGWRRWAINAPRQGSESAGEPKREPRFKAPAKSQTGGLLEGLEEHDRSLGLSPSGRVRSALFNAAHSDVAPQLGVASFRVTVRNDGAVEISVHGASDNEQKWQEVASRAAAELRKNPPRIPPPRTGARMLVEIKAESVMPNGAKVADMHGTRIELEAPRIRSVQESKQALKDKNPAAEVPFEPGAKMPLITLDLPGVYLSHVGKVCGVRAGLTPFGLALSGGCDPANIGSKPARMVHTRIREESLF